MRQRPRKQLWKVTFAGITRTMIANSVGHAVALFRRKWLPSGLQPKADNETGGWQNLSVSWAGRVAVVLLTLACASAAEARERHPLVKAGKGLKVAAVKVAKVVTWPLRQRCD